MLIAGNWKMFHGPAATAGFCTALRERELDGIDVVVCPPFVSLAVAVDLANSWSGNFTSFASSKRARPEMVV